MDIVMHQGELRASAFGQDAVEEVGGEGL